MLRWTHIVGALMLVLMIWTGGLAHAAEQADCIPASAETAAHYDGDDDQNRSNGEQGVAHHHTGCSGHQLAAPSDYLEVTVQISAAGMQLAGSQAHLHGHDPESELRPPIA